MRTTSAQSTNIFLSPASCFPTVTLMFWELPSRHTVRLAVRPHRNLVDHAAKLLRPSMRCPLISSTTSFSFRPALAAGLSGTIFPRSAPRSSGQLQGFHLVGRNFRNAHTQPASAGAYEDLKIVVVRKFRVVEFPHQGVAVSTSLART